MSEKFDDKQCDGAHRFLFEQADVRGERVRLEAAFGDILSIHEYAPGVRRLLGELLAAAVLLRSTLKFDGKLILQARSRGQIPLLMAECTSDGEVRGIARGADQATATVFEQLLGDGSLTITVDPIQGQRYQGIVPLQGDSLAHCIDAYFQQSEQLGTRLWLVANDQLASGLLLQQLPPDIIADCERREQFWEHACTLAETITPKELLSLSTRDLLYRLYHQDAVRLFEPSAIRFHCSCSRERTLRALAAIEPAELESILAEQGAITMDCEFCNQQYTHRREDLQALLGSGEALPILH
ncbi:MAG: Hsp33 family molecular chaperone HslO [Pseudomonadota bacterium]